MFIIIYISTPAKHILTNTIDLLYHSKRRGNMEKKNYQKNKNRVFLCVLLTGIMTICFILTGCSDVAGPSASEISSDLRNTTWTKQNTGLETITISFGMNTLTLSGDGVSSQYDQQWDYRGGYCCGNGYCIFYNGQSSLEFRYRRGSNGLIITGSNVQSLNGSWTRK